MLSLQDVKELCKGMSNRGGRAYLVGGFVRDQLMGVESKDFDLEVFGVEPAALKQELEIFSKFKGVKFNVVGESFQVYKLGLNLDVSLPRRDRKVGKGHKGFVVEGDPQMSTVEAARRRDFTMNAMFFDPLTGEVIDHFGGKADLANGVLRMVDPLTFVEDSLRVLRAVQFASRFGLTINKETKQSMKWISLRDLPRERVWMEFEKWLMQSPKPSGGLFLMKELGILEELFPELEALVGVPQDVRWHPEGDVFVHTALALDEAKAVIAELPYAEQVTVMLATMFHDLGKPETTEFKWLHSGSMLCVDECLDTEADHRCVDDVDGFQAITAHGHAEAGVSLARNMLDRLAVHSIDGYDVREQVLALVENHMAPFNFHRNPPKNSAFLRLATKVDLKLLHKVCSADSQSRNGNKLGIVVGTEAQDWFLSKITNLAIPVKGPEKLLMGRHLIEMGVKPGKFMGQILDKVYELQLDGLVTTVEEAKHSASLQLQQNDYFSAE